MKNNSNNSLFVGDSDVDPSEKALISRLRRDLERSGVRASVYANFFPKCRKSRQVDLLVRTDVRTAHVEIKGLRPDYPLRGRANGNWVQLLPDGTERQLDTNFGRQALDGTFAISDAMRGLARRGVVTGGDVDFKKHIDTIVGMWEAIPAGSDIEAPPYVTVCGYAELLQRLTKPGQPVPWTDDDWDTFAREHSLYQQVPESETERHRRRSIETITDYCQEARDRFADGLRTFVDVGVTNDHDVELSVGDIGDRLVAGIVLAVVAPSGSGKSFLAQRLALSHCDAGRLVVSIQAGHYKPGNFTDLLARSMSRCSAKSWITLAEAAKEFGVTITIILDGLNGCPSAERNELLDELKAFTLRYPAAVLITSTAVDGLPESLDAETLRTREPDARTRRDILAAHGAKQPRRISDQFRTPYELSIAAQCESELDERSSVAELHAAWIRRFAASEQIRAGLRAVATHLHSELRTSMSLLEATSLLHHPDRGLTPSLVDEVLGSHILVIEHHRVRFRHELVGQFLAAEDLVRSASSGQALGQLLTAPANTVLGETALTIEVDHHKRWEALQELANPNLIFSALTGAYGAEVAETAAQAIRDILHRATATVVSETVTLETADGFCGRWLTERRWTELERPLLAAAGQGLTRGLFVNEVCELIDRTDEFCLAQARRLKGDGEDAPISQVVGATYTQMAACPGGDGLAVSYIVRAFDAVPRRRRLDSDSRLEPLAGRIAERATARSWGRYYLALLCVDPDDVSDQALFATLFRRAWSAGGYHLQLLTLSVAGYFGGSIEPHRSEILNVLEQLEPHHWMLRSSLVEALSSFGEIESPTTAEELRARIRATISHPDKDIACQFASVIVSSLFEDEAIVGPYCEAIDGLTPHEKARLFTMAALGSDPAASMWHCWTLDQLTEFVPTGDDGLDTAAKSAFAAFLDGPPEDAVMPNQAASACLAAIRGWAKFERVLPLEPARLTTQQRIWRLVVRLLLRYERSDVVVDVEEIWSTLLSNRPETLVTLASLEGATQSSADPPPDSLQRLIEDYPGQLRCLFEWALANPAEVPTDRLRRRTFADNFVTRILGAVGDESTAARLKVYLLDPDAGRDAADAIRRINRRLDA